MKKKQWLTVIAIVLGSVDYPILVLISFPSDPPALDRTVKEAPPSRPEPGPADVADKPAPVPTGGDAQDGGNSRYPEGG